jgi:hypothetical protein
MRVGYAALAAFLVFVAGPVWADENESSEITHSAPGYANPKLAFALPKSETPPYSATPAANLLALPEPEMAPIAPYSSCHRSQPEMIYLTN